MPFETSEAGSRLQADTDLFVWGVFGQRPGPLVGAPIRRCLVAPYPLRLRSPMGLCRTACHACTGNSPVSRKWALLALLLAGLIVAGPIVGFRAYPRTYQKIWKSLENKAVASWASWFWDTLLMSRGRDCRTPPAAGALLGGYMQHARWPGGPGRTGRRYLPTPIGTLPSSKRRRGRGVPHELARPQDRAPFPGQPSSDPNGLRPRANALQTVQFYTCPLKSTRSRPYDFLRDRLTEPKEENYGRRPTRHLQVFSEPA